MKKRKFLLVAPAYACNPISGNGQRTQLIYQGLLKFGSVDILLVGTGDTSFLENLFPSARRVFHIDNNILSRANYGLWKYCRPLNPKMLDKIANILGDRKVIYQPDPSAIKMISGLLKDQCYDFVVYRYLRIMAKCLIENRDRTNIILDIDDRDDTMLISKLNRKNLNFLSKMYIKHQTARVRNAMKLVLPKSDHIWVVASTDTDGIEHSSMSVLPNIPYQSFLEKVPSFSVENNSDSKTILFVGSASYWLYYSGILKFLLNSWDKIQSSFKDAKIRIVGSGPWSELKPKVQHLKGVEIVGFADDLEQEYRNAAFTIVPIFEGGGTKIKILESLYYGRTVVVASYSNRGYEHLKDGESLLLADNEENIVQKCCLLLENSQLRTKIAKQGQKIVQQKFSFNHLEDLMAETFKKLTD